MFHIVARGLTDVGLERKNNEDDYHIDEAAGFFVVCDGMGGHASGEIASRIAVETMAKFATETVHQEGFRFPFSSPDALTPEARVLDSAVRLANRSVFAAAQTDARHKGMGTTLVGLLAGKERLGIVHVGDSRIYLWRRDALTQVTEDHSLLNHYRRTRPMTDDEIRNFKGKNVIVRAVGLRDAVQPEVQGLDVEIDDILLMCTDGLSDLVDDAQIGEILRAAGADLQQAIDALLTLALAAGGKDNITVVALQIVAGIAPDRPDAAPRNADIDDTSPGFKAANSGQFWDEETMPSYELPQLPDAEAKVIVASEFVDAPTPPALAAVTQADIAAAQSKRRPGHDSAGKLIPPPPPVTTAPSAQMDGPPPIPTESGGEDTDTYNMAELNAATRAQLPAGIFETRTELEIPFVSRDAPVLPRVFAAPSPGLRVDTAAASRVDTGAIRTALAPAVDATFRLSSVRRPVTSRTSGSPAAEMPFTRRPDSAELGADAPADADEAGRDELGATAKYRAIKPAKAQVAGDSELDASERDLPTMQMAAVQDPRAQKDDDKGFGKP